MKYKQQIESFVPSTQEEQIEKELFLKYLSIFDDVLTRKNNICHLTSSAFIVNKDRTKVLAIYHKIYNSWGWTGGHADGDEDLIYVAEREAKEETSIKNLKLITDQIVSLDVMPVHRHYKKGEYVPTHIHLSVAYLFEGDENDHIQILEDENSGVAWFTFEEFLEKTTEPHMIDIYKKIIEKAKQL